MSETHFQQPADSIGQKRGPAWIDKTPNFIDFTREQLMEHFERQRRKENKEKESDEQ